MFHEIYVVYNSIFLWRLILSLMLVVSLLLRTSKYIVPASYLHRRLLPCAYPLCKKKKKKRRSSRKAAGDLRMVVLGVCDDVMLYGSLPVILQLAILLQLT